MSQAFEYARPASRERPCPFNDNVQPEEPATARETAFARYERASTTKRPAIRRELVKDMIPLGAVGFIGGQSGAFKTFFALDLAAEIATGGKIAGKPVHRKGGVVVLAYEGEGTLDERWAAICADKRLKGSPPVFMVTGGKQLTGNEEWAALIAMLSGIREGLDAAGEDLQMLIIDTVNMSGMIPADKENEAGAWASVFTVLKSIAQRFQISVALVHHAGKDVQAGLRGSSAAHAAADFVIMCETERDQVTGEVSNRWVHIRKTRYGTEGPLAALSSVPIVVTEDEAGNPVSTLVMRYDTEANYHAKDSGAARDKQPHEGENKRLLKRIFGDMAVRVDGNKWEADIDALKTVWMREAKGSERAKAQSFKRALFGDEKAGVKGLNCPHGTSNYSVLSHTLAYFGCDEHDTPVTVRAFGLN